MGGAVKVEPTVSPGSDGSAASRSGGIPAAVVKEKLTPPIPPEERLRASVAAEFPAVESLTLRVKGSSGSQTVAGAVVVGRGVRKDAVARQIAETHGVALPDAAIETIDPETWKLMKRLEQMGVIQFCGQGLQTVVEKTEQDLAALEREKRHAKIEKAMSEVARFRQMGELLWNGGFAAEAQTPLRKAVLLVAAVARFALGADEADGEIVPLTDNDLVIVRGELDLQPVDEETLDLAARGAALSNPVERVRHFVDECRLMF